MARDVDQCLDNSQHVRVNKHKILQDDWLLPNSTRVGDHWTPVDLKSGIATVRKRLARLVLVTTESGIELERVEPDGQSR